MSNANKTGSTDQAFNTASFKDLKADVVVHGPDGLTASEIVARSFSKVSPSPSAANVFFSTTQEKVFIGTAIDKEKLAAFSDRARIQLTKHHSQGKRKAPSSNLPEVMIEEVDLAAGRAVLAYINLNDLDSPKPLGFEFLGSSPSFIKACKLHHACHAFGINRVYRSDLVRNRLWAHLRNLNRVILEDFEAVFTYLYFDDGLTKEIKRKTAFHTVRGWIPDGELENLFAFARDFDERWGTNLCSEMVRFEADAKASFQQEKEELATFVHESAAPVPLNLPKAPQKKKLASPTVGRKDEKPVSKATTVTPTTAKKVYGKVGGVVGNVKPAPGLAEMKKGMKAAAEEGEGTKGKGKEAVGAGELIAMAKQGGKKGSYTSALRG